MSEKAGKSDKHVWTLVEDELLIHSMLALHENGELLSENGLRPGVLNTLKNKLHELIPGCQIQAHPHIQSRYKKLKANYGVVTELLNLSGFGWDSQNKCVTAPKTVWDEYIKVNRDAAKFRHTPFPYYEELGLIFGKDRANGKDSEQYDDVVEEINNQPGLEEHNDDDTHISNGNNLPHEQAPVEHTPSEHAIDEQPSDDASVGSKKRKRNSADRDEFLLQGMERIAHTLAEGFKEREKRLNEREKRLDDMRNSLYDDIMQVEGISDQERHSAFVKIMSDDSLLIAFNAAPQRGKVGVLRHIA